jgi:hypothetical protein
MQYSTAWRVTVVMLCLCCSLLAQNKLPPTSSPQAPSLSGTPAKKKPVKTKLTPQQEQGLRLLKAAASAATGLTPPARSYVLWQVSHGYRKVDQARADAVLRRAFAGSRAIEDQPDSDDCQIEPACHVQRWLQEEILLEMMRPGTEKADPERVEKLLPEADAVVRKRMLERLASEYIRKGNLDRALQLMDQIDDDHYSYFLAGQMMAALPASRREERLAVFAQAFRNYQNRSLEDVAPNELDDFGVLLVRFWRDVPSMALDAVDTILDRSKDRDESKKAHSVTITLMSGKSLGFESEYEYRLFQLLPILKEVDESKAESLLAEHDKARAALDQYPSGMQSLDPNYYGDKPIDQKTMPGVMDVSAAVDDDPVKNNEYQAKMQLNAQVFAQLQKVTKEMEDDPESAYQDAMNLPLQSPINFSSSPRAVGLRRVAFALVKKNPTLAKAAMNEARRLMQDAEPSKLALFLAEVPDFYLKLGDEDGARSAIKDQVKVAEKLYAIDSDAGDPNLAFKGAWPSSNAWRNSIQQATKVSPAFAEEILAQIPDPDIAGFQQVMYANTLLGAEKSSVAVIEWHKGGRHGGMFMSN